MSIFTVGTQKFPFLSNPAWEEMHKLPFHWYYYYYFAYLKELPFGSVSHVLTTVDCQPTEGGGVLVYVVGQLKV